MNANTDLKELWMNREVITPASRELFDKVDDFKRTRLRRLMVTNALLLLTSTFIACVWFYYLPEMITTKIGIVVIILSMTLFLLAYNQMIPLLVKVDDSVNSTQYLQMLLRFRSKQLFLQNAIMNIY